MSASPLGPLPLATGHLAHWREVSVKHAAMMEVLEFAEEHGYARLSAKPSDIADELLEVDRLQLDIERRALLAKAAEVAGG